MEDIETSDLCFCFTEEEYNGGGCTLWPFCLRHFCAYVSAIYSVRAFPFACISDRLHRGRADINSEKTGPTLESLTSFLSVDQIVVVRLMCT